LQLQGTHNDAHHYGKENNGYEWRVNKLKSAYSPKPFEWSEMPKRKRYFFHVIALFCLIASVSLLVFDFCPRLIAMQQNII
jgi:hypothetical protein